ncbi:hypothetical protein C8N46_102238 [Kordia periserrulae]|uniref:Uncharacterized protein n=1 Tax=Kordia periserrulae TaxID=701523 RepID=A0A2T6C3F4_9FLAO|nr:hypothetical protein [Kordia periserrulae]PTX62838.1 hypothetical protein C8N46_102238 [Kordia periserrulae]
MKKKTKNTIFKHNQQKENKITAFLRRNDIWFTAIASILLSTMALVVSYNSYQLNERQALIEYTKNHPEFQVYKNTWSSNDNGIQDNIEIIIKNKNNSIVRNIDVSTLNFLIIKTNQRSYTGEEVFKKKKEPKIEKYFLLDQFGNISYSSKQDDFLVRLRDFDIKHATYHNDSTYLATQEQRFLLYTSLFNKKLKKLNLLANFKRELYIKITYKNFLNERVTDYFKIELDDIHSESYNKNQKNNNAEFIESKERVEKLFNTKEKLNFISFVSTNSFKNFEEIINDKKKYSLHDLNNINTRMIRKRLKFKNRMNILKNDKDSILHKHVPKFDSISKKFDSIKINKLLEEMKHNRLLKKYDF